MTGRELEQMALDGAAHCGELLAEQAPERSTLGGVQKAADAQQVPVGFTERAGSIAQQSAPNGPADEFDRVAH